jgi:hypothetical protein
MAKPKTELAQQRPPPPYTRGDQGESRTLSQARAGKRLRLSLETQDRESDRHSRPS